MLGNRAKLRGMLVLLVAHCANAYMDTSPYQTCNAGHMAWGAAMSRAPTQTQTQPNSQFVAVCSSQFAQRVSLRGGGAEEGVLCRLRKGGLHFEVSIRLPYSPSACVGHFVRKILCRFNPTHYQVAAGVVPSCQNRTVS